jgi:hypothetical protein
MKKVVFVSLIILSSLYAEENDFIEVDNSFITKFEYGKMLYTNPRGIGCNTCHGNNAKGKEIVSFNHVANKKNYNCTLAVPSIKNIEYNTFFHKINSKKNKKQKFSKEEVCEKLIYNANVMPTYFLVEKEIEAIYYYINNLKKK